MKYSNETFDDIVQKTKEEFGMLNHDALYYELVVILPAINMYINGIHGALFAPNLFSAVGSIRMAFEAIGAFAYFEKNDPNNQFFNYYLHNSRICEIINANPIKNKDALEHLLAIKRIIKENSLDDKHLLGLIDNLQNCFEGKLKVNISVREQLDCIDTISEYKSAKKLYDQMCEYIHFGSTQVMGILRGLKMRGSRQAKFEWQIGPKLLSRQDRSLIRKIALDSHKNLLEIIQYSSKNNNKNTNRFNYSPAEKERIIPKRYQAFVSSILN